MAGDIQGQPGAPGHPPPHDFQKMPAADPRAVRAGLGLLALVLAGLGAVLPVVPGWLFLVPAIWLLAHRSRRAARLVDRFHARFRASAPRLARRLARVETRLDAALPGARGQVPTVRDAAVESREGIPGEDER